MAIKPYNPKHRTYKGKGTTEGTTAQIYVIPIQVVADSTDVRDLVEYAPVSNLPVLNQDSKCIALGFADFFPDDRLYSLPMFVKYGFQGTFYCPFRPLNNDPRNTSYWTLKEVRHIERAGCWSGEHGYQHFSFINSYPEYDGLTTPTNNDLRADAGAGKNKWGHTITDTLLTSLEAIGIGYLQVSAIQSLAWQNLSDANCDLIRKNLCLFGQSNYVKSLDYLGEYFGITTGSSYKDADYTAMIPNTADGGNPSANNRILGGIFQGAATTQNHEAWERIYTLTSLYKKTFEKNNKPVEFYSTSGGALREFLFPVGAVLFTNSSLTKINSGASKYTSSITGESRSLIDVFRSAGGKTSMLVMGMGYGDTGRDGTTRKEGQRIFKKNASLHKPDYMGDGFVNSLRQFNVSITAGHATDLLASVDLVKDIYDLMATDAAYSAMTQYTNEANYKVLVDTICRENAWNTFPDAVCDFVATTKNARVSMIIFLEAILQFLKRAGYKAISHEQAANYVLTETLPADFNYWPNPTMLTTPKTVIVSDNAPDYPDGWNGGVVLSEEVDSDTVNIIHLDNSGGGTALTVFTRSYAVKPGTMNLNFWYLGTATLNIYLIRNNHVYSNTVATGYELWQTIALDAEAYTEVNGDDTIVNAPLVSYSPATTPLEEVEQNYWKGYENKVCGIHIELVVAAGNELKLGKPIIQIT